jgi:hypothetical protein
LRRNRKHNATSLPAIQPVYPQRENPQEVDGICNQSHDRVTTLEAKRATRQLNVNTQWDVAIAIAETPDLTPDNLTELETRLAEMKGTFDQILQLDYKIEEKLVDLKKETDDEVAAASKNRTTNRFRMMKIKRRIDEVKTKDKGLPPTIPASSLPATPRTAQLPKLKLPTFDGSYTKWSAFWDAIRADVLTGSYAYITKFNYIFGQLQGTAREACMGIHASGENLKSEHTLSTYWTFRTHQIISARSTLFTTKLLGIRSL